jgi:hypothetical protein
VRGGAPPTNGPDPLTQNANPPHTPPQPHPTAAPPGDARTTPPAWNPGQQAAPEPRGGEENKEQYPSQCSGVQKENFPPGSKSQEEYPSRAGTQNKDEYPSQGENQGGSIRESESSGDESQENGRATGGKAKGKERITRNGWQVVIAKRRKRHPATPATQVEPPKYGMQTRSTRETTPSNRGPLAGHQDPAGESPLDKALVNMNPGELFSSKGPPAGHSDPAGRGPSRAARQAGLPHRWGSAPLPGEPQSDNSNEASSPPPPEGTHSPTRTDAGVTTARCQWVQGRGTWTPEAQQGRGGQSWAWPARARQDPIPSQWTTRGNKSKGRKWQNPSRKMNVPSRQWNEGGARNWELAAQNWRNTSPWQGQQGGGQRNVYNTPAWRTPAGEKKWNKPPRSRGKAPPKQAWWKGGSNNAYSAPTWRSPARAKSWNDPSDSWSNTPPLRQQYRGGSKSKIPAPAWRTPTWGNN